MSISGTFGWTSRQPSNARVPHSVWQAHNKGSHNPSPSPLTAQRRHHTSHRRLASSWRGRSRPGRHRACRRPRTPTTIRRRRSCSTLLNTSIARLTEVHQPQRRPRLLPLRSHTCTTIHRQQSCLTRWNTRARWQPRPLHRHRRRHRHRRQPTTIRLPRSCLMPWSTWRAPQARVLGCPRTATAVAWRQKQGSALALVLVLRQHQHRPPRLHLHQRLCLHRHSWRVRAPASKLMKPTLTKIRTCRVP
mmetsp:Transcript_66003/g.134136  ORF Transcript_66003/g.134136 Transcript_66003/m.134136 type:complete len:247 (-) Transcript_66003:43-783(-)